MGPVLAASMTAEGCKLEKTEQHQSDETDKRCKEWLIILT